MITEQRKLLLSLVETSLLGGTLEEVYNMQDEERNNLLELANAQEGGE